MRSTVHTRRRVLEGVSDINGGGIPEGRIVDLSSDARTPTTVDVSRAPEVWELRSLRDL